MSDSNYSAATLHQRPSGKPMSLEIIDDDWATDKLDDDDVEVSRHEQAVAPLLDEGDLDADAIVVSPAGSTGPGVAERQRREEGWNDLGLDQLDRTVGPQTTSVPNRPATGR